MEFLRDYPGYARLKKYALRRKLKSYFLQEAEAASRDAEGRLDAKAQTYLLTGKVLSLQHNEWHCGNETTEFLS